MYVVIHDFILSRSSGPEIVRARCTTAAHYQSVQLTSTKIGEISSKYRAIINGKNQILRLKLITLYPNPGFYSKSLYLSIPIKEALQLISDDEEFLKDIMELVQHFLTNSYFLFESHIYKQTQGAAVGSSLSSIVAKLFMAYFEKK